MQNRWLDEATYERLAEMIQNLATIQRARADRDKLEVERKAIYERQEKLRANLGALQPTGQEATLRNRILNQLEQARISLRGSNAGSPR